MLDENTQWNDAKFAIKWKSKKTTTYMDFRKFQKYDKFWSVSLGTNLLFLKSD